MKRDMELIRKILFEFEKMPLNHSVNKIEIESYSEEEITYNIILMNEAGLIEIKENSTLDGIGYFPERLTWQGHQFLENIKNETVWKSIKSAIVNIGGEVGFSVLKMIAEQKVTEFLGLK